jgi:predicted patatin/cPLA2 family phospholipase
VPVSIETSPGVVDQFLDGGITNNIVSQAIAAGASDVTLVYMDRADLRPPNERLSSIADVAIAIQDIRQQRMLETDLELCRMVNKAVLAGNADGKRFVSIRTISPQAPLGLSAIQFDNQALIDAAFEQGQRDGETAAAEAS